jgi:signal peptidase I
MASLGSRATTIATWTALAVAVLVFVAMVIGPMTGRYRLSVILSDSMKPHWETGDVVISLPERPADVRVGQVITFNPPIDGRPSITHRVVRLVSGGPAPVVVTKGDGNAASDEWGAIKITSGPVMRVRGVVPNLGWALKFLTGRTLAVVTTVICPILLLLVLLWRIWRPPFDVTGVSA